MAEGDLVAAELLGLAVKTAAAETGAERADVAAFRDQALDDGVGVLILDVVFDVDVLEVLLECFTGEVGDVLVDINGNEIELDRRALRSVRRASRSTKLSLPPLMATMTRSPSSIMPKSVMAWAVRRMIRFQAF